MPTNADLTFKVQIFIKIETAYLVVDTETLEIIQRKSDDAEEIFLVKQIAVPHRLENAISSFFKLHCL